MRCMFLPPHMLRALAETGDPDQRDRAHATLELSAQFRGERAAVPGIPNHACYLAATAMGGKAWEVAGRIWYAALTAKLRARATFRDCARATCDAAAELYGAASEPQRAIDNAWRTVGIDVAAIVDRRP